METLYEKASLILNPGVYDTGKVYSTKPFDGSGDLTFTRTADTATRVGPDGLIEKVRTNLATYSSDFSQQYSLLNATISTNTTTDPFGTSLADSHLETATSDIHAGFIDYNVISGTELTYSIYAKSIGGRNIRVSGSVGFTGPIAIVDLSNGTLLAGSTAAAKVTSAGNGWFRISITGTTTSTNARVLVYSLDGTNTSFAGDVTKGIFVFGRQLEYGVPTDYIATTTAEVSVGPVANLPRLDYLGSSCGKLLLEPQRTNSVPNSENFNAVSWLIQNSSVTSNAAISPTGYMDADKLVENTSNSTHRVLTSAGLTISGSVSISFFAKKAERSWLFIGNNNIVGAFFNLENGTIGTTGVGITPSIIDYGNGWYRCIITASAVANERITIYTATADNTVTYTGDGTSGLYIWGATIEAGAYATSYIPTLGAAVTRGADACSKTGISSLINSAEGTLFTEISGFENDLSNRRISLSDGTANNSIRIFYYNDGGTVFFRKYVGGVQTSIVTINSINQHEITKIAIKYNSTNFDIFANGVKISTNLDSNSFPTNTLNKIGFADSSGGTPFYGNAKQLIIFPTALTDAQLAELTTL